MIKPALLFVASTGLLVYFVAPVSEKKAPPIAPEEIAKPQPVNQEVYEDDDWDDDETKDDEEFVFGEPMTFDDNEQEDENDDGELGVVGKMTAEVPAEYAKKESKQRVNPRSPKPGKLGSATNPIPLKTTKPSDTSDDD